MSSQTFSLDVGITKIFPCSYLTGQEERLLMLIEPEKNANLFYPTLISKGFRRSGDQIYRPDCPHCQACQSLRIPVKAFQLSRSQKRLVNRNKKFKIVVSKTEKTEYFNLYQNYINKIHSDGVMFPASRKQYEEFIKSSWNQPLFIEIYDQDKLIAVSVTDQIDDPKETAWSAFYCFYDPNYQLNSLGKYAILTQLKLAKTANIDWLYLGYYIKTCQKMSYKIQFNPHQRLIKKEWTDFNN